MNDKIWTYKGAYVTLTYKCNTDICPYCYARGQKIKPTMDIKDFKKVVVWLKQVSNITEINLVGGEPTILPNLKDYLDILNKENMSAIVYTNGSFDRKIRKLISTHSAVKSIIFHYEPLHFKNIRGHKKRFITNIARLSKNKKLNLLFIIDKTNFNHKTPLKIAEKYNLNLGWVFSAPTSGKTHYLNLKQIKLTGRKIEKFLLEAKDRNVRTYADLTIPLCLFSDNFFAKYRDEFKLVKKCLPFVYFKPDLSTQFCTALPKISSKPIGNAEELKSIIEKYRKIRKQYETIPSFKECVDCDLRFLSFYA